MTTAARTALPPRSRHPSHSTRGMLPMMGVQAKLYLREPMATFFTIAFAPLMLVLFGLIYGNEPDPDLGGQGAMDVTVPAYIALVIVSVGLIAVPIQTSTYRELGILRRYRATPMRPLTFLIADVAAYYLMTLTGTVLLIAVGMAAFGVRMEGSLLAVLAGFTLSALAFFALGYLVASVAPSARVAQTAGMLLAYPMMFLSGASLPLELLPPGLRTLADFIPLTYVVKLMRGLWYGEPWADLRFDVLVLSVVLVAATALSVRFFRWQ